MTTEIQQLKEDIAILQEKLQKLEEIEKQPRMNLQQEGEYAVVSYHDKTYYRLEGEVTFSWYIKKGVSANYRVPTLVMVEDAETERLLEGIYYNHIQVKKEKEQRTKTPVEECYKDWWGQYPELETDSQYDDTRWQGFQAGYEFAYAISTAKEVMEKVQEEQKWDAVRESVKWCEEHPNENPLDWLKPQTPEQVEQGLKEAFREAVKQGVVSSSNKPQTLYDVIADWWEYLEDTLDMDSSIKDLVNDIEEWLPKEQSAAGSQNAYVECSVEGFNDCLKKIKGKLR
jgi:hypothetical protein